MFRYNPGIGPEAVGLDFVDPWDPLRPSYSTTIEDEVSGNATVSYDSRTNGWGSPMAALSSASFDLGTGELAFYGEAMGRDAESTIDIRLSDTIYPAWDPLSESSGTIPVEISWSITGDYDAWSYVSGEWAGPYAPTPFNHSLNSRFYYKVDDETTVWTTYNQYNLTDGTETWTQTIMFDPMVNTSILIGEMVYCSFEPYNGQLIIADFSGTGIIEVTLPEGALFTSDSGVFLTGSTVVPIPGALLLLGSGLTGFMLMRRRGKK